MMNTISTQQLLSQLSWRYATKQFDPTRKIPADTWTALEDSLVLTPSSFGMQPWKFIVVTDQAVREKLVAVSWGQRQVADASHLVVFAIRTDITPAYVEDYIKLIAETRKFAIENLDQLKGMILGFLPNANLKDWASRQVYIALGQFMASCAALGVDSCPMEGIDPAKYDEVLGLSGQNLATVVACPAGYRAEGDKYAKLAKVRFKKSDVIVHV